MLHHKTASVTIYSSIGSINWIFLFSKRQLVIKGLMVSYLQWVPNLLVCLALHYRPLCVTCHCQLLQMAFDPMIEQKQIYCQLYSISNSNFISYELFSFVKRSFDDSVHLQHCHIPSPSCQNVYTSNLVRNQRSFLPSSVKLWHSSPARSRVSYPSNLNQLSFIWVIANNFGTYLHVPVLVSSIWYLLAGLLVMLVSVWTY